MAMQTPPNASEINQIVADRVKAVESASGGQETVTVEWRGQPIHIPVITMPVDILHYNPDTHRIRAQRSTDSDRENDLASDPFGAPAQGYLHQLLMGDPTDPSKVDPSFTSLKDDLEEHGQNEPGIITRSGVLINGNTRRAALRELGQRNIRVGVLPVDAGHDDLQSIELALQLRKDYKRDYSFMNFLLAVDERATSGQLDTTIQEEFRIKKTTYERSRWILEFVREAINRSKVPGANNATLSMKLVNFEGDKGKLEELHTAYAALKLKSSDSADALREQRLLALILDKSKTDLRLIDHDFAQRYMKSSIPAVGVAASPPLQIPGTTISVPGPSSDVLALRQLVDSALRAKAIVKASENSTPAEVMKAAELLGKLDDALVKGLDLAGKQTRLQKRRLAAVDRLSDACDDLELATGAVADARATGNFDVEDLDEVLIDLRNNIMKLSAIVLRNTESGSEGVIWLRAVSSLTESDG